MLEICAVLSTTFDVMRCIVYISVVNESVRLLENNMLLLKNGESAQCTLQMKHAESLDCFAGQTCIVVRSKSFNP